MRSGSFPPLLAALLLAAALRTGVDAQQQPVTVLRGSGPNETATFILRAAQMIKDRVGHPTSTIYRVVPTETAVTDFVNNPASVDFAVISQPLTTSQATGMFQVPFAMFTVSVFYNIPSAPSQPLNLTACLIAKLVTGQTTTWVPSITAVNPNLAITDTALKVTVYRDAPAAAASQQLMSYLSSAAAGSCALSSASSAPASWSATMVTDVAASVMATTYSIGYMLSYQGSGAGLKEAAILNPHGEYVTTSTMNLTNTVVALQAVLPSSPASDASSVQTMGLPGVNVFPIIALSYMAFPSDQSTKGDKGAMLAALASFILSAEVQGYCKDYSLLGVGTALAAQSTAALSGIQLQSGVSSFTFEPPGTVSATGYDPASVSASRQNYDSSTLMSLQTQIATMTKQVQQSTPKLLRGSGSSAVTDVVWRDMDSLMSMATTPILLSYRGIGPQGGEAEIMGMPPAYKAAVDFAVSEAPMSKAIWTALSSVGAKVVQVPLHVAPLSFFVNINASSLPSNSLKLSACTLAGIFSGSILTWNDAAIAQDNPGVSLPAQTIVPIYQYNTGTNAVWSQYMATACPGSWTLGTGSVLPGTGATGKFAPKTIVMPTSSYVTYFLGSTPWSIACVDTVIGVTSSLLEVSIKNKNGAWLTAQTADKSAAAVQMLAAGGWPSDPTADFSGLSVLDLAGDKTWPISYMPFLFARLDMTSKGDAGPLLQALLTYMLSASAQASLAIMQRGPVPSDMLLFAKQKAIPLLAVDTRKSSWYFESSAGTKFLGAGDAVFSAAKDTYTHMATSQFMAAMMTPKAATTSTTNASSVNTTEVLLAAVSQYNDYQSQVDSQQRKVDKLQSVTIASVAFAVLSFVLCMLVSCRYFVVAIVHSRY